MLFWKKLRNVCVLWGKTTLAWDTFFLLGVKAVCFTMLQRFSFFSIWSKNREHVCFTRLQRSLCYSNMIKKPRTYVFYDGPAFLAFFRFSQKTAKICENSAGNRFQFFFNTIKKPRTRVFYEVPAFFSSRYFFHENHETVCFTYRPRLFFLEIVEVTKPCVFTVFQRLESTQKYRVHLFSRWLCFFFFVKSVEPVCFTILSTPHEKSPM